MTLDHVVGEPPDGVRVVARGKVLKRADPDQACGHSSQYRPGQRSILAENGLAGGHRGERARGWNAERVHCLAHEILAQHRAERGAPITAARIGSSPGALQLNVAALAASVLRLAQQEGAAVAQLRDEY